MESADEKKPFEEPDNGVSIGDGSPFQYVPPPLPPRDDAATDTAPLPVVQDGVSASDLPDTFGPFRRHLKEPFLRLLPTSYSPKPYRVLAWSGLGVIAFALLANANRTHWGLLIGSVSFGVTIFLYPLRREIHRWWHRRIKITRTSAGYEIEYLEPDSAVFMFTGENSVEEIEGSRKITLHRSLVEKFFFWGCGSIVISGKIDGPGEGDLSNVPNVKKLYAFLRNEAPRQAWWARVFQNIRH